MAFLSTLFFCKNLGFYLIFTSEVIIFKSPLKERALEGADGIDYYQTPKITDNYDFQNFKLHVGVAIYMAFF